MLQRIFISPIGFTHRFIVDFLVHYRVTLNDKLILLARKYSHLPPSSETRMKTEETLIRVKEYLLSTGLPPDDILEVREIPVESLWTCLSNIVPIVRECSKRSEHVYINLSCGMRMIVTALLIASLLTPNVVHIFLETEDSLHVFETTNRRIRSILFSDMLDSNYIRILLAISEGKRRVREIANKVGLSVGAVSKSLARLRELELVEKTTDGFQLTEIGHLLLKLREL